MCGGRKKTKREEAANSSGILNNISPSTSTSTSTPPPSSTPTPPPSPSPSSTPSTPPTISTYASTSIQPPSSSTSTSTSMQSQPSSTTTSTSIQPPPSSTSTLYVSQGDIDNYKKIKKLWDEKYIPDFTPLNSAEIEKASEFLSGIKDEYKYGILRKELIKTDPDLLSSVLKIKKCNTPKELKTDSNGLEAYLTDEVLKKVFTFDNTNNTGFYIDLYPDKEKSKTDVSKEAWKVVDPEYQKININFKKFFVAKKNKAEGEKAYTFFAKHPVISRIGRLVEEGKEGEEVAEIKNTLSPMCITLQHEMSHLLDYNTNEIVQNFCRNDFNKENVDKEFLYKHKTKTPHSRLVDLMQHGGTQHNLGEQRAILSGPYSEARWRIKNKEPIRYSHVMMKDGYVFFEPVEKIKKKMLERRTPEEQEADKDKFIPDAYLNKYYSKGKSTIFNLEDINSNNIDVRLTKVSLLSKFSNAVTKLEEIINKDTVNKDTVNKDTVNKDTVNKDTVNKDTVNKDTVNKNTEEADIKKKYKDRLKSFYEEYISPERRGRLITKYNKRKAALSAYLSEYNERKAALSADLSKYNERKAALSADLSKTEKKLRILANIMQPKEKATVEKKATVDYKVYLNAFKSIINQETGSDEKGIADINDIIKILEL